jgi:molybdate transport system substrate-binding protein
MAIGAFILTFPVRAEDKGPVVFAAASLKDALDAVNAEWKKESGTQATISYAASSALAKQIEQGAPADIFVSADEDWMNYLADRKLIEPKTRFDLVGNKLVLIAPNDSKLTATISSGFPLASLLSDGHLAMADTASVPAGKYGKAALEKLGVWDGVKGRIAQAEKVRGAASRVTQREPPLNVVRTDAVRPKVRVPTAENTRVILIDRRHSVPDQQGGAFFLTYLKTSSSRRV